MIKSIVVLGLAAASLSSCQQGNPNQPTVAAPQAMVKPKAKNNFKHLSYASKTDPVCGMPVTAGIEDTLNYKGKRYGFCSTGCKEEFVKNPKAYLH